MLNRLKIEKNLSANGYIEATILITPKGNIHQTPVLTFRGIPVDDVEEFIYGLEDEIEEDN
jgi:ribonuclease J